MNRNNDIIRTRPFPISQEPLMIHSSIEFADLRALREFLFINLLIARERYKPNIEAGRSWTAPCEKFVFTADMLKMCN